MTAPLFRVRDLEGLLDVRRSAVDSDALATVVPIVESVRREGESALRQHAEAFGEIEAGVPLFLDRAALARALDAMPRADRTRLERVAARIRRFAELQRDGVSPIDVSVPGGAAGHRFVPMERVGCYAPGGRYPLPSSVVMTVIPARVAGVSTVWVASPRPAPSVLAAAHVAGADGLLAAGGAQAIAALAFGVGPVPPSDIVVGPGNRFVTAAKYAVAADVAIDMLAGPSELVVLADDSADPEIVAADLLAQAEHDPNALPILVSTARELIPAVAAAMTAQLEHLPTAGVARQSLANGGAIVARSVDEAIAVCDRVAPEHLSIVTRDPGTVASRCRHYGTVFIGGGAGEALGDYGAGPNHTLPTGGSARRAGALSPLTFLRVQSWLRIDDPAAATALAEDAAWLGRVEGLEAHARSAERRVGADARPGG